MQVALVDVHEVLEQGGQAEVIGRLEEHGLQLRGVLFPGSSRPLTLLNWRLPLRFKLLSILHNTVANDFFLGWGQAFLRVETDF